MINCAESTLVWTVNIQHGYILKEIVNQVQDDKAGTPTEHLQKQGFATFFLNNKEFQFIAFPFGFFFKQTLTCSVSANAPVNSNHPGWIFQAWVAVLLDYFCIGVIMRNDLRADCMRWHRGSYDISNPEPTNNTSVKCSFLQPRNLIGAFS